jgi:hypothetical protein
MATPGVTGTLALIYERYKKLNSGANPDGALIKAIVMNTADDIGNAGPDFRHGYGRLNAKRAVEAIEAGTFTNKNVIRMTPLLKLLQFFRRTSNYVYWFTGKTKKEMQVPILRW